jgi:hypothetical protein
MCSRAGWRSWILAGHNPRTTPNQGKTVRRLARSLAAACLAAAVPAAHAAYQDFDQLTAPTGVAQMVYAPKSNSLVIRNSASGVAVVDIPTRASQIHLANYRFNDMSLAPSGGYLFAADYGGENIGYGSPLYQSYVHRFDFASRVWDQKLAHIAGNVQAVSDTSSYPEPSGKSFWESEASRMVSLGADINEVWYVMATYFLDRHPVRHRPLQHLLQSRTRRGRPGFLGRADRRRDAAASRLVVVHVLPGIPDLQYRRVR